MYPRNAATPPVIDLGEIVLKSDGTQQTTGASVRVRIGTGAWGAGAGTLACDATSGIWTYAPTQAETNADYFVVGAYKASCTSVSKTVITSNSATSGTVLLAPVTHTSAVLPNLDAAVSSRMASYTQPTGFLAATFPSTVSSYAGGAVASVTAGVTVTTNNDKTGYTVSTVSDKTGYSLTAGTGLGNQTANITGNLSGSVGSVTTVSTGAITTASFAAGAIDAAAIATDAIGSAEISAAAVTKIQTGLATPTNITAATGVTLAAVTHTGAVIPTVSTVTNGVTLATTQPAITFGAVTIDVSGSTPNITLTGSGSGNGIEWTRSGSGNPLDADVVDQIQSGLSTEVAAIKTKTDQLTFTVANKVDSAAELDSAVGTQITNIENASGYLLAVLAGACADPQTASETYAITVFGSTFTVDMAGQTSTGTRTAPTLTKT